MEYLMPRAMEYLTPREIVKELDRYIIGQHDAKRAVAIALRNRWRRQQLNKGMKEEVIPKNILMIGPTGVGKTEIARRLAKLAGAPFIKVEATKFTEVGYVGRDVEQIIRDLVEIAIQQCRDSHRKIIESRAQSLAEDRLLDALVGEDASYETRERFRILLQKGDLDDREVEIEVEEKTSPSPLFDVPGMPGAQMGMININDLLGKSNGMAPKKRRRLKIPEALQTLIEQETESLIDQDKIVQLALNEVEQNGIVFIDEFDKICSRGASRSTGGDISREGVQRDLLPLIEGTTVSTKHGLVRTDHILFICSGAFHIAKPSDLLPELQGRLPNRVELKALTQADFVRVLTEPEASLIKQYVALLGTEEVTLSFSQETVEEIARLAVVINEQIENIGARRLQTVLEKTLEEISFDADQKKGDTVTIAPEYVREKLETLIQNKDLSKFIL